MILFIFQNFMKKYLSLLWLIALLSFINLWATAKANYDLQIDEKNNEVYLMSGDTQITLDNVNKYITWLDSELNLWLIATWDAQILLEILKSIHDQTNELEQLQILELLHEHEHKSTHEVHLEHEVKVTLEQSHEHEQKH